MYPLPNKSDITQAADQTTVLLFLPKILVYVSLIIIRMIISKTKPIGPSRKIEEK